LLNMAIEGEGYNQREPFNFEFPIHDSDDMTRMKTNPASTFPNFRGMASEYPYTFVFEFDVLCRSYDYSDSHKLKLFPSTRKELVLHWFMVLRGKSTHTWEEIGKTFLKKY